MRCESSRKLTVRLVNSHLKSFVQRHPNQCYPFNPCCVLDPTLSPSTRLFYRSTSSICLDQFQPHPQQPNPNPSWCQMMKMEIGSVFVLPESPSKANPLHDLSHAVR